MTATAATLYNLLRDPKKPLACLSTRFLRLLALNPLFTRAIFALLQVGQELSHLLLQAGIDDIILAKSSFTLGGFLGQNMAVERLVAPDFSFSGLPEPLGRSPVTLHLRHTLNLFLHLQGDGYPSRPQIKKATLCTLHMASMQVKT